MQEFIADMKASGDTHCPVRRMSVLTPKKKTTLFCIIAAAAKKG
jgi:hypothetical protein